MGYLKLLILAWSASLTHQTMVTTAQGLLRGETHEGHTSYNGIPYATITEGGKFKRAGLAPTWTGVRESQQVHCAWASNPEECLTLDVHVPAADPPWPVLVWVRGGRGQYNPSKLIQQGIIVVIVRYRYGPSGFLCLDDERMPGNAGAKDVVLALRWVRDNIAAFKGNPNKVVLGGQGFAATIVEALLIAPMAKGLFHGAIIQSGTMLSPWAFNYDAKERSLILGQMLTDGDEPTAMFEADIGVLAEKSEAMNVPYFPFGMCVEMGFRHEERLLSDSPHQLLSNKFARLVPLIEGFNSDEAYIFLSLLRQKGLRKRMARDLSMLLPEELKFSNEVELKNVVAQIQEVYFKNNLSIPALLAYHRDAYFINHIARSVRFHAASSLPVYYYRFSYAGSPGVQRDHQVKKAGAAHSDELAYLFPDTSRDLEGADGAVQQNLIRLWTNFVKHLVPTLPGESPRWEPVDVGDPRLLDISSELSMQKGPRLSIWDNIYDRYYYIRSSRL